MKLIRIALLTFAVCMFVFQAAADYDYDGTPEFDLTTVAQGTINGEVYVGGGHGVAGNPYQPNTYTQNFTVPDGTVTFARFYVGVWGGKDEYNGTLQTNFNGNDLGTLTLMGEFDSNAPVWCTGHGVYWVYYDVTTLTTTGFNTAIANTNQINPAFDGRMYGIVLVAVVENAGKTSVEYWINDGHWNLNYLTSLDSAATQFIGTIVDPDNKTATLTTVYLTGDAADGDTLQFNNGSAINDAADGCGSDEWGNSWQGGFDIDTWNMADYGCSILETEGNVATFDRGDDPYLHPVLAVLQVRPEMCGDVNVDGSVNIFDVVKIRNRASNTAYVLDWPWAADVNDDGTINIFDVVKVRNRASNTEYPLACQCQ
jgi:hypothetical protein